VHQHQSSIGVGIRFAPSRIMANGLQTPLTQLLNVKHPVMLAGMGAACGHELVAAVSNAGGFGTLGGYSLSPDALRREIKFVKDLLEPGKSFGVDLLLPQVGGSSRKTNYDYTYGKLEELIDIVIEEKAGLFVSATGVPPKWAVDKLHAAGIPVMNMIGAPHHVAKALEVGVDVLCAQGTEAGGHTGPIATLPLIPQVVDAVRGHKNYFGSDVLVVAAGGIYDGRGLAASLALGAAGAWVGTRFIATPESAASPLHRTNLLKCKSVDTTTTTIFTGRPARVMRTPYLKTWEERPEEVVRLTGEGKIPFKLDVRAGQARLTDFAPTLMGQCAGAINDVKPAKEVVESMVAEAVEQLQRSSALLAKL